MKAPARLSQQTIDEVRARTSLVSLVQRRVKLRRAGRGWKGLCPFHKENTPSFVCDDGNGGKPGSFHCYGCGAHGGCFDWVEKIDGVGFREAVILIAHHCGVRIEGEARPHDSAALDGRRGAAFEPLAAAEATPSDLVSSAEAGRWIWRSAGPARGEIVEKWLAARGLDPLASFDGRTRAIDQLRFHPRCPVSVWKADANPEDHWLTRPAMVAGIADLDGLVRGVHLTFLSPDGTRKASLPRTRDGGEREARKIFGKLRGNAVRLTPIFAEVASGGASFPMIIGEGIETSWSFAQTFGTPCQVAAALSLENLQGAAKRLGDGSLPLWNIEADPARPPFIDPAAEQALILVDADMKPLRKQRVQLARGARPVEADISGSERARICAALATQHWRRAGVAKVSAVRPRMGLDFNDAVRSAA